MDDLDEHLLARLRENARAPVAELARAYRGQGVYQDSQEELTRTTEDALSLLPAAAITLGILLSRRKAVIRTSGKPHAEPRFLVAIDVAGLMEVIGEPQARTLVETSVVLLHRDADALVDRAPALGVDSGEDRAPEPGMTELDAPRLRLQEHTRAHELAVRRRY